MGRLHPLGDGGRSERHDHQQGRLPGLRGRGDGPRERQDHRQALRAAGPSGYRRHVEQQVAPLARPGSLQHCPAPAAGAVSPARGSGLPADADPAAVQAGPAHSDPAPEPGGHELVRVLLVRSVLLASGRRPDPRHRDVLQLRCLRRQGEPHQVQLRHRHRG